MLNSLLIKNFALIDELEVSFSNELTIITGETGAGKSIILDALELIMGKRADGNALKNSDNKCIIEAQFSIENYNLFSFFEENNLEYDATTILRRELLPTGKTRAFINDVPVTLQELQMLSEQLLDIHSQHKTLEISKEDFQFQVLDALSNNETLLSNYQEKLKEFKETKNQLSLLKDKAATLQKDVDYNNFLLNELIDANIKIGEQEEYEKLQQKLSNTEVIIENLAKAKNILDNEELGILYQTKELKTILSKIATYAKEFTQLLERTESILIEVKDIILEIDTQSDSFFHNPDELEKINHKLQILYSLQKKHSVSSEEELIQIQESLQEKLTLTHTLDQDIDSLISKIAKIEEELLNLSNLISNNRKKNIPNFIALTENKLKNLGMPNAKIQIEITTTENFTKWGKDSLQFLFSANTGLKVQEIKKIASGGELSRIMLSVKSILAQYKKMPTIIFDEIDTGVSGEIANKMGEIMEDMSKTMQVFAITHLPQIASKGNQHFKVFKTSNNNETVTQIKNLNTQDRIHEIALMLSGNNVSETAIQHAKQLLN